MLERGSYIPWTSQLTGSAITRLQDVEDLQGDDLLYYDAEMKLTNMILLSFPNEFTILETRFTNEFDQFVVEPGESLVSVYNRFAQLMNDLERNNMKFPIVSINTKFLRHSCATGSWLKYGKEEVRNSLHVRFGASSTHGFILQKHLFLLCDTSSSVVDYDEEFEQDDVHNHSAIPPFSLLLCWLLAKVITQNFSNQNNHRIRACLNTRNQAVVQGEVIEGMNATNETANVQRIVRTTTPGNTSTGQCYNCGGKENMLVIVQAKGEMLIVPVLKKIHMFMICVALETLARNAYDEAAKQQRFAQKGQTQNETLTSQI
ncbi:hypothetical protein Tco_0926588 [Tanacetum coccineum]|uniref:Uncharacterized protein n=1 Tax=Tanacetum coccineum TaxID=301880 RepID=A0ABQ5DB42_9ASTR